MAEGHESILFSICLHIIIFSFEKLFVQICKNNSEKRFKKSFDLILKFGSHNNHSDSISNRVARGPRINGGANARELISRRREERGGGRGVRDSSRPAIICTRPIGHVIWIFEMVVLPVRQAGRLPSSRYWDGFNSHRAACTRLIWPHLRRGTKIPVNWP